MVPAAKCMFIDEKIPHHKLLLDTGHASFFHNSHLIRRMQQHKMYNLTRDWTQIACLAVMHLNN